eukprot:scaffold3768_cov376-Prasinococcus_capsulatus_cf.AAC.9
MDGVDASGAALPAEGTRLVDFNWKLLVRSTPLEVGAAVDCTGCGTEISHQAGPCAAAVVAPHSRRGGPRAGELHRATGIRAGCSDSGSRERLRVFAQLRAATHGTHRHASDNGCASVRASMP